MKVILQKGQQTDLQTLVLFFAKDKKSGKPVGPKLSPEMSKLLAAATADTGFAGAAIAAELGTMVVGEEIEALEAQALNPVRFLVIPRVLASVVGMLCLAVVADIVAILGGLLVAVLALDLSFQTFFDGVTEQAKSIDFVTGVVKSGVFGFLIGLIACNNGLRVSGGAAGVGKATTDTVVQSVVAIVIADMLFTAIFFAWKLT